MDIVKDLCFIIVPYTSSIVDDRLNPRFINLGEAFYHRALLLLTFTMIPQRAQQEESIKVLTIDTVCKLQVFI